MKRLLAAFIASAILTAGAIGQEVEYSRQALEGFHTRGVPVFVEVSGDPLPSGGVTSRQLQTDVELRLRRAGIKIQPQADIPSYPQLIVKVSLLEAVEGLFAYSVTVEVFDFARLDCTDRSIAPSVTWQEGTIGVVGREKFRSIRDNVNDYVDRFVNAYLAANPK
jgi:hypothetical protein